MPRPVHAVAALTIVSTLGLTACAGERNGIARCIAGDTGLDRLEGDG